MSAWRRLEGWPADARHLKAQGIDPIEHRKQRIAGERVDSNRAVTFSAYADRYITAHQAAWKNPVHRQQWQNTIDTYAKPVLGTKPLCEIQTADVMEVIRPLWSRAPETASRLRGRIEVILDAAGVEGYRDQNTKNPAAWKGQISHLLPSKKKVRPVKHHPAVPWEDMPAFMAELRNRPSLSARALEFTILTATRASESCAARWSEIDLAKRVWTIPGERMKGGKEHRIPLVGRALAILEAYSPEQRLQLFIFPGYRGKPLGIPALGKMLDLMSRTETTHGMRSAFKDWASESTSFPDFVVEMALAHAIDAGVEAAYRRGELFAKRTQLMTAWDEYLSTAPH
jgi:integrase